jgi:polar amino acid transport system substrate-binding protein
MGKRKKLRNVEALLLSGILALTAVGCGKTETVIEENVSEQEPEEEDGLTHTRPGERLEEIQESGVLLIGISPDYAPFAFLDEDGNCAGSDVSLGNYLAEELDVKAKFVEMDFDACLEAVKDGTVDLVLLGMLEKEERKDYFDYTDSYYEPGNQVLLVKSEAAETYSTLDDLTGKTLAAQYGTLQAQLVAEQLPESYMELTNNVEDGLALLNLGQADALALDEAVAEEVLKNEADLALASCSFTYTSQPVKAGVVKGEAGLLEEMNQIIDKVVSRKLYFDWLEEAFTQAASLQGSNSTSPADDTAQ